MNDKIDGDLLSNKIEKREWFQITNNLSTAEMEYIDHLRMIGKTDFSKPITFPNNETKTLIY